MKKQIAVLMAAATAVTTVAPALASADVNTYDASVSEINAKIKAALNERYKDKNADGIHPSNANEVDAYMNSRYAVVVDVNLGKEKPSDYDLVKFSESDYKDTKVQNALDSTDKFELGENSYVVKDASRVQGLIENKVIATGSNDAVKVAIVDKGIKDGSAVETMTDKHYVVSEEIKTTDKTVTLNQLASDLADQLSKEVNGETVTYIDSLKVTIGGEEKTYTEASTLKTALADAKVTKIKLTLKSGKEYTLEANDKAFDLTKPLDKNGNELKLDNAAQNIYDQVESFKFIENKDGKSDTIVLPVGDTNVYTVQDVQASVIELGKIFTTKDGYTKDGAEFVNGIIDAKNKKNGSTEFNYNGVNYTLADANGPAANTSDAFAPTAGIPAPVLEKSGDGYVLRYSVRVVLSSDKKLKPTILQFVIKGDSQKDLDKVLEDLKGTETVVAGRFTRLEGSSRYATAIEVSKEKFNPEEANTVVIVGGEALMDGLSAVPLASVKNAPILLSHPKSGLSDDTINEISRACKGLNRKTVYVVGGENSVPEKAVKQLEEKFGAVVMRISGSDRYETSLEVAKRLGYDEQVNNTIYLAGGEGAADAMSVSPVAANIVAGKVSPVLVVPKASLKRSTRDYIAGFTNGYIIGGESTVSSNVYRDINNTKNITLNRVAGSDRYDTNVQLLKKFYSSDNSKIQVKGAIFTSGDTKFLVDAQTAGPLAASKNAPIVLAGSKLTNDQVDLLKDGGLLSGLKTNIYQVGGVVSSDVMSVVVDKLGL